LNENEKRVWRPSFFLNKFGKLKSFIYLCNIMKNIGLILMGMACLCSSFFLLHLQDIGSTIVMGFIFGFSFILFLILLMEELKEKNKLK